MMAGRPRLCNDLHQKTFAGAEGDGKGLPAAAELD
jgi:hypothetical protein